MKLLWCYDETIRMKSTKTAQLGINITPPKQVTMKLIALYISDANGLKWTLYQYPPSGLSFYMAFYDLVPTGNRIYFPNEDNLASWNKYKGEFIVCNNDELTIETSDDATSLQYAVIGIRAQLSGNALPLIRYHNTDVERHPTGYYISKIMGVIE